MSDTGSEFLGRLEAAVGDRYAIEREIGRGGTAIVYLAEDINRKRTWLTMFLANSPVIFKILIGTNPDKGW